MWILCGCLSVAFCITGWIMVPMKKFVSQWASVCSLAFVSLTLLMEYRICNYSFVGKCCAYGCDMHEKEGFINLY